MGDHGGWVDGEWVDGWMGGWVDEVAGVDGWMGGWGVGGWGVGGWVDEVDG
ncbi:MAG: hypothetical protein AAF622_07395 [Cyanobacteria bacterium P01_C01_bin.147]